MSQQKVSKNTPTVLIIDDDREIIQLIDMLVKKEGLNTICSDNPEDGYQNCIKFPVTAILLDIGMAGLNGIEFLKKMEKSGVSIPTVFVSGLVNMDNIKLALKLGAIDILEKPFDQHEFTGVLHKLVAIGLRQREIYEILTMIEQTLEPTLAQKIKDLQRQILMLKTFESSKFLPSEKLRTRGL